MSNTFTKNTVIIAIALFSMYFGAGNLIIAPYIGAQAGADTPIVMLGFCLSGVVLPILAILALVEVGTPHFVMSFIHPRFADVLTFLVFLILGPVMAVPRTAACAFEMSAPVIEWTISQLLFGTSPQESGFALEGSVLAGVFLAFCVVFFACACVLASHPSNLTDFMGKYSGPALLILMCVLIAAFFIHVPKEIPQGQNTLTMFGAARESTMHSAPSGMLENFSWGFVAGYQTMDIFGSFVFWRLIVPYVARMSDATGHCAQTQLVKSGIGAGLFMIAIYCGFAFVGYNMSGMLGSVTQGAEVMAHAALFQFGMWGSFVIAIIFTIACLNVCMTLSCAFAEYMTEIVAGFITRPQKDMPVDNTAKRGVGSQASQAPEESSRRLFMGVLLITLCVACAFANIGLSSILAYSVMVLNIIYPLAILTVLLATARMRGFSCTNLAWKLTFVACGLEAFVRTMRESFFKDLYFIGDALPLGAFKLEWIVVAASVFALGTLGEYVAQRMQEGMKEWMKVQ